MECRCLAEPAVFAGKQTQGGCREVGQFGVDEGRCRVEGAMLASMAVEARPDRQCMALARVSRRLNAATSEQIARNGNALGRTMASGGTS